MVDRNPGNTPGTRRLLWAACAVLTVAVLTWAYVAGAQARGKPGSVPTFGPNRWKTRTAQSRLEQLDQRIEELTQKVAQLEAKVAERLKDNEDLLYRLMRKRGQDVGGLRPTMSERPGILTGIRDGELYEPTIIIWNRAGGPLAGSKPVVTVKSGFPVRLYRSDRVGDQEWYQVYTYHETPVSYGWVLPTLFRDSF